jgi:hypothetical protein
MSNATPDAAFDRSADDITKIVQRNRDKFRCCYDWVLKDHTDASGSFVLKFTLNPDGTLKEASHDTGASDIKIPAMGECAINVLKTISFPPSKRGKESAVSYPFVFKPKGGKR